jgi:WD40 repeat protein
VLCLAYTPDGRQLASGSWDKTVKVWDIYQIRMLKSLEIGGAVFSVAYSPDAKALAVGGANGLSVWTTTHGWNRRALTLAGCYYTLTFLSNGTDLATEGEIWDLARQRKLRDLPSTRGWVQGLAFSAQGQYLAAACSGSVGVLQAAEYNLKWDLLTKDGDYRCLAISPDGRLLAAGGQDGSVRIWDVPSRHELTRLPQGTGMVLGIAFTPDGKALVTGTIDGVVKVWEVARAQERAAFNWEIGAVRAVAFSPDGMTAAAGGFDNRVLLWDME